MRNKITSILIGILSTISVFPQSGHPKVPLMGWASWNNYRVNISDSIIKRQTDAMISSGLANAGYNYINIDDGFFNGRKADGSLLIDAVKFPKGMKVVADYIHSKGLKAGFYSEAGANTCGSIWDAQKGGIGVGLYNHDQQDIDSIFLNWGYDFLKVDYCGGQVQKLDEKTRYTAIKQAIDNTGLTHVNFNVCRWQFPGVWVTSIADSWRISNDIGPSWLSVTSIIDLNTFLSPYVSPGHYNDMDMLEVGRGMTTEEDKSHFSMWCIMSAPLVLGNDLTTISQQTTDILTNGEVISVNQDTTGEQAHLVTDNGSGLQVWAKNINGKQSVERAVILFNRADYATKMSVKWKDLNLSGSANVRDLWLHADLGIMDSMYTALVPSHGVKMLKVVGTKNRLQEVFEAEYAWINNFNLTQNAAIVPDQGRAILDASCSGRAKAGWLGNNADNYIEFRNVYADTTKYYNFSLTFICGENRNATISINRNDTLLTNLNSGGWSALGEKTISIKLNKGYNNIRISNANGWLPDIDKIMIDLNKTESVQLEVHSFSQCILNIFPNPCRTYFHIDSEIPIKQVMIYSMTGELLKLDTKSNISVSDLTSGHYIVKIDTGKVVTMHQIIKE